MIRVTVILPNKKKGEIDIDPQARLIDIKNALVDDLGLGNHNDFILAVIDKEQTSMAGKIELQDGDSLMLVSISVTNPRPISKADINNFS